MKIGIVTFWSSSNNYGQILQCYALQKYLRNQGHDAFLIRYKPQQSNWGVFRVFVKLKLFLSNLFKKRTPRNCIDKNIIEERNFTYRKFEEFRSEFLKKTTITYKSIGELRSYPPEADVYVCGSDQIWNGSMIESGRLGYFLRFGDVSIRRVAYAVSGGLTLKWYEKPIFKRCIKVFDRIGTREESTLKACKRFGRDDAVITIDPTLLIEKCDFDSILVNSKIEMTEPFLFFYVINVKSKEEIYWSQISRFAKEENLNARIVYSSGYIPARELVDDCESVQATIPEWLSFIRLAKIVFTTSYHGVAFCIVYHRPFYAILLQNEYAMGNDRIISLLTKVGLLDRIIRNEDDLSLVSIKTEIDWENVDERLQELRQSSIEFLNDALHNE